MSPVLRVMLAAALALSLGAVFAMRSPAPGEAAGLPVITGPDLTPRWYTAAELAALPSRFPDFELTDQSGEPLQKHDLHGRIVVANFFFTGCATLCPRLRGSMARVRDAYADADDVRLLSHSVTPELDQPRVLEAYASANGVDGRQWRLLTGTRETLERVTHEGYGVPRPQPGDGVVMHSEWLILLDPQQRVRGIYNGSLPIEVDWLIRDIQRLRTPAAG